MDNDLFTDINPERPLAFVRPLKTPEHNGYLLYNAEGVTIGVVVAPDDAVAFTTIRQSNLEPRYMH